MIIPLDQVSDKMDDIVDRIRKGEIFVYPTDTIAGIGCIGNNQKSVERLFNIKQRDHDKPISYAFADPDHILEYAELEVRYRGIFDLLPGPLTLILRRKKDSTELYGLKEYTIGVRVPEGDWFLHLIKAVGYPIVTTSANITGESPSSTVSLINKDLRSKADFIISWEGALSKQASTIISLIDDFKMIREGKITRDVIMSQLEY
jgi:tRNA threonylcarbamoyl adenosine modification protein (Sua5/YciO/YrdC/YwlC family)